MKIRNFLKKTLAVVLAFAMLAPIMGNLEVDLKEVKAEETSSEDSLNVKCQVTQGVVTDTNVNKYRGNYVIRFVSGVKDYTAYSEIGFKVMEEGQTESEAKTAKVKTVFKRIESTTGSTATEQETYTFSPKVINTDSEYFITAKLPVAPANKAVKYTVWAYGIKKDGTPVEGQKRCLSVEDGQKDCETINMSFENTSSVDLTGVTSLTVNDTYTAEVIGVNDKTVHVRISGVPTPLKSATSFTFKNGDTKVGSGIFRNLYTDYDGNADTSWYTEYSAEGDTEFTIATSADLYGLASLVNASEDNVTFADKTIYVVSDIKVNKGTAKETGWVAATGASIYPWTSIGTSSKPFSGTFDGCMHSISGISLSATSNNAGFFGYVKTDANATRPVTVKNLKLTNSYMTSANAYLGSVAGYANGGVFDNVKSDAIVVTSVTRAGGFIGMGLGSIDMDDCWFAGKVTTTLSGNNIRTGGFMGTMYSGTLDMTNCLNTGAVSATSSSGYMKVSGFVGEASSSSKETATVNFTDCLNAGTVTKGTGNYGAFVGYTWENATVNAYTSYNTDASAYAAIINYEKYDTVNVYDDSNTAITVADMSIDSSAITGDAATAETGLAGFDFDNIWIVVTNGTPVLKSFEDEIINPDTSWYSEEGGTAENPFVLYDKNDLYGFANLVNGGNNFAGKIIRLGDDIVINKGDAEDYAECVPQFEWTPIGTTATTAFAGTFDGSDPETGKIHSISGLYLNASSNYAGLFGVAQTATGYSSATVKNLKLTNSYCFSSAISLGSVIGYLNNGTVDTLYSKCIVESSSTGYQGGIIGIGKATIMNNCWFAGMLKNTNTNGQRIGGLIGQFASGTMNMTNCLNTGTLNCAVTKDHPFVAGLVGSIESAANITDCLNTVDISVSSKYSASAIAGNVSSGITVNIYTSYTKDTSSAVIGYKPGVVNIYDESNTKVTVSGHYATVEATGTGLSSATTTTGTLKGFDCENVWEVTDATPILKSFSGGVIAPDTTWYDDSDTYILYNAADLYGFSKLSQDKDNNFEGKTVQLGADIVVNEGDAENWAESVPYYSWMPIGQKTAFKGIFDGADPKDADVIHSISGLYFETSTQNSGLFGQIDGTDASIQNLKLTNSYFETSANNIGSIVGSAKGGNISSVYSDAIVVSSQLRAGGFVGIGTSTVTITNSWYAGTVANENTRTGGFVGDQYSGSLSMINCLNTGLVDVSGYTTSRTFAGGLVGNVGKSTSLTLNKCLNTGIKCIYNAAEIEYGAFTGFVDNSSSLTITNTYADNGKWDSLGYYSIKNKDANENDVTTYSTINGYYGNDNVDTVKELLATLLLEHSAVIGDAAKDSLEGFDFDSTWTVLSDDTVALAKFADMKVADTEKTALHSKLVSSQSLVASSATKIATLPEPTDYTNLYYQGGCTTDGEYFYQAVITYKDTKPTEEDGTDKDVSNEVRVVKYNLSTGETVWSDTMALNHANDITYNSKLDRFVVCHNAGNAKRVSYLKVNDAGKLEMDGGADLKYSSYSIDYNAIYDRYVVGRSGAEYFDVYDSNFNVLYSFEAKEEYKAQLTEDKTSYTAYITQGIACDDNYIYCVLDKPDVIVVYDWFGCFVTKIDLSNVVDYEPENISIVGNSIYVTDVFYYNTELFGKEIELTRAYVYKIDASALVKDTSAQ